MTRPPPYHAPGFQILDPNDGPGLKSKYITHLQEKCLRTYMPRGDGGIAVDLGCGFGRITPLLNETGWIGYGVDPVFDLLNYARQHNPGPTYIQGKIPDLPFAKEAISLLLLHNLLRPLLRMQLLTSLRGIGSYVAPRGHLVVVDNIWPNNPEYIPEQEIVSLFKDEGFKLELRVPFRAARWWLLYLIRYGLVPKRFFDRIAEYELRKMKSLKRLPSWQYSNVFYLFKKQ